MIILDLSRQLIKHLTGQLNSIIVKLLELYELNQISNSFIALLVHHIHVIVIELMHDLPIVTSVVSNSNDNYAQRQSSAFD